jgi:hypothetical protein
MCDCDKNNNSSNVNSTTVIYNHNECIGITVDLLEMYLRPVQCCLNNSIFEIVNSTQAELESTKTYLESYITAKRLDPQTCEFKDQLPPAQSLVNRIIIAGICI